VDPSRDRALEVLIRWERRGSPVDPLFHRLVEGAADLDRRDKALARELVYGVLRWLSKLDYALERFSSRRLRRLNPVVRNALRLGAYQLLMLDRIPPWAAVSESVELVKARGVPHAAGFVNAVLRALERGRDSLRFDAPDELSRLALKWAHPLWLVKRWVGRWGLQEAEELLKASNAIPPFAIRVNPLRSNREELLDRLQKEGFSPRPTPRSPWGIIVEEPEGLLESDVFEAGLFQVQDEGAQLVSWLLTPQPGDRVLDLCAAPGGKTTHLAEMMGDQGEIVAVDVNPRKLKLLRENCRRLGISIVRPLRYDARRPLPLPEKGFDRVLVDAPCTGLGVLRRNPDTKWRVREGDPERLSRLQLNILEQGAKMVRPQGMLLYSTCTLTEEENEEVVKRFLQENPFELADPRPFFPEIRDFFTSEGFFLALPHRHGTDGFFAALFRRLEA